jgi:integrase
VDVKLPNGEVKSYPRLRLRGAYLEIRLQDPARVTAGNPQGWYWTSTSPERGRPGLPAGEEAAAEQARERAQGLIDTKRALGVVDAPRALTVKQFFDAWTDEVEAKGIATRDELRKRRQRVRDYMQAFVSMDLERVDYPVVSDWNAGLRARIKAGDMAPLQGIQIVQLARSIFRRAVKVGRLRVNPFDLLEPHEKIKRRDKGNWREGASFEVAEMEQLISDPRIEFCDQVNWAFCFFLACRPGEMERIQWSAYTAAYDPLPRMIVYRRKVDLYVPCAVHPTLAAMLAEWWLSGWQRKMGRAPTPDDYIFPMFPSRVGRPNKSVNGLRRNGYTWRRLNAVYRAVGLRRRRPYDFRRTLITLAVDEFDASESIIKAMTHPKAPGSDKDAFDLYRTKNYKVLCREILKVQIHRKPAARGEVRTLPAAANAGTVGTIVVQAPESSIITGGSTRFDRIHTIRQVAGNARKSPEVPVGIRPQSEGLPAGGPDVEVEPGAAGPGPCTTVPRPGSTAVCADRDVRDLLEGAEALLDQAGDEAARLQALSLIRKALETLRGGS